MIKGGLSAKEENFDLTILARNVSRKKYKPDRMQASRCQLYRLFFQSWNIKFPKLVKYESKSKTAGRYSQVYTDVKTVKLIAKKEVSIKIAIRYLTIRKWTTDGIISVAETHAYCIVHSDQFNKEFNVKSVEICCRMCKIIEPIIS